MGRVAVFTALLIVTCCSIASAQGSWYRGNVHVHTDRSDGNSPPVEVVEWYMRHDYDFLVLTDHNLQAVTVDLAARFDSAGTFLLLPGIEVTDRVGGRPVHLNGLGVRHAVAPQGGLDVAATIRRDALAIEAAGGVAVLNHPNGLLSAALTADEVSRSRIGLFEVCCADYMGGSGHPSTDEIWDAVLTSGQLLNGIAADDAHDFGPGSQDPGSAWIMVRSRELSGPSILAAIRQGDFYATTGVTLTDVRPGPNALCLTIADYDAYGYRTEFIGPSGRRLLVDETAEPCYRIQVGTAYVRARVQRSDGARAWVQPVMARHTQPERP